MVSALFTALALIAAGQAGSVPADPGATPARSSAPSEAYRTPVGARVATRVRRDR